MALSGGGTRGFAHIGVIEALEEEGIRVAGIVGTSIGSVIGALNASGYSAKELREIAQEMDLTALLAEHTAPMYVFTGDGRQARVNTISYKKSGKSGGPLGILTGDRLFQYYVRLTSHVGTADFSKLPIPYAAIAADIKTGEKVILRSGTLPSAMRASMSIPGLFEPWEVKGRLLVDGGLVSNLPVDTAKELFPGFPVIGVDVSDNPNGDRPLDTLVDVVDQSLTILMRRTTEEESRRADILIIPDVLRFPFLGVGDAEKVIQRGKEAALEKMGEIRLLSGKAPSAAPKPSAPHEPLVVRDVRVVGLPEVVAKRVRKRFLRWVGKPLNADSVESALRRLMTTPDISVASYSLQREEKGKANDVVLVLDIRKDADLEIGVSGYSTNLDPYRWLYLKGTMRGVFSDLDSLHGIIRLSDQWGFDLSYLTASAPLNSWEFNLSAQNWRMSTTGGYRNWDRYVAGGRYLFRSRRARLGLGLAYEHNAGTEDSNSFGPTFFATQDTLDIPSDPTKGQAWRLDAWWPDGEELLYRFTFFKVIGARGAWRTYLRFGYVEGDLSQQGHAAYLGAAEELYSIAARPIEAERMAWVNMAFRHVLRRGVWGIVATEVFGAYGYAMNEDYKNVASPWEVGLALTIPNNVVNLKLAAIYGSEEFKLGFFLGVPVWDRYPLP
ncbi:MAG: patatin-like phospholipase family protein [Synergistaceae bacterium]|nr:patatin-like phospholipase family protein [Synergistaceae bacterium]